MRGCTHEFDSPYPALSAPLWSTPQGRGIIGGFACGGAPEQFTPYPAARAVFVAFATLGRFPEREKGECCICNSRVLSRKSAKVFRPYRASFPETAQREYYLSGEDNIAQSAPLIYTILYKKKSKKHVSALHHRPEPYDHSPPPPTTFSNHGLKKLVEQEGKHISVKN